MNDATALPPDGTNAESQDGTREAARVNPRIHPSWREALADAFAAPSFAALKTFLLEEKARGATVYPPGPLIFNAFDRTPFDAVKVVILGQDPYHGPGQAHGLSFSVPRGVRPPPSLQNIFKEQQDDLGIPIPGHGNLEAWADRGVFLLNSCLTVRAGSPGSHAGRGWEEFTSAAVAALSRGRKDVVFLLWGRHAKARGAGIDVGRHHVLEAAHPSPFSAHSGFFGCRHFSKANALLERAGVAPVDWRL